MYQSLDLAVDPNLNKSYFLKTEDFIFNGKVETPEEVVSFMVQLAIEQFKVRNFQQAAKIRWLDPACGTGAFVLGILEAYFVRFPELTQDSLPNITAVEIDSKGIEITRSRVSKLLSDFGYDFERYQESGGFNLIERDFLEISGTNNLLFGPSLENFDIAIGNPPYVRSNNIRDIQKSTIKTAHPEIYEGSTDLYGYFYTGCINILSKTGILCLITPVNFMKSASAEKVRNHLLANSTLTRFVDFGERPIFNAVSVHSGIFVFAGNTEDENLTSIDLSSRRSPFDLDEIKTLQFEPSNLIIGIGNRWAVVPVGQKRSKALSGGKTLRSEGFKIFSGIRTGKSSVYLLVPKDAAKFEEQNSKNFLNPIVMPTDIEAWKKAAPSRILLNLSSKMEYPTDEILTHLKPYKELLSSRTDSKGDKNWFQIRSCDYMDEMKKEKIVFPDISKKPRFGIAGESHLVSDGAYFITSTDYALLAILNSSHALVYFENNCLTIGTLSNGGRIRMKKNVVLDFPLPNCWGTGSQEIVELRKLAESIYSGEVSHGKLELLNDLIENIYRESN